MEENKKENVKEAKVTKTKSEKICPVCNTVVKEGNKYCSKCGAKAVKLKVVNETKEEKEKKTLSSLEVIIITTVITILICLLCGFIFIRFFYDDGHINTTNKNVTIDDTGIADAVEKVYDSVVVVENYMGDKLYGTGSGFVYKTDNLHGYILTNNHVLQNATSVKVIFTGGEKAKADVVDADDFSDVAVLKVDKKYVKQVAITGKNQNMRIGDTTFAIGAPLDSSTYSWSVTRGILSGKDRMVSTGTSYMNVIQTDTPINSGNSGGPLCNANGEVIGITNMKLASDQIEGMGFAIPIETAVKYANNFVTGKDVKRPYVGVAIYDASESFFSQEVKVVVESVEDDSPADEAGIKKGDIITKIGKVKVTNSSFFKYKLYSYDIGDKVKITVERDGKEKVLTVIPTSNSKKA